MLPIFLAFFFLTNFIQRTPFDTLENHPKLYKCINLYEYLIMRLKSVVFDIASTIDSIFKNEHPIKFRLVEMKKMILIRVISFLMNVDHKYKNGKIKKRR